MEKYEKLGERLVSKVPTKEYKENFDAIFGKKESWLERREREAKEKSCKNEDCFCTGECKVSTECLKNPENCIQYDNSSD